MLLTLLLSENTSMVLAGLFMLAPVVLVLYLPIILLSRRRSSDSSKVIALGLALLLVWPGSAYDDVLGWLVKLFCYLPLGIVFVNILRSSAD